MWTGDNISKPWRRIGPRNRRPADLANTEGSTRRNTSPTTATDRSTPSGNGSGASDASFEGRATVPAPSVPTEIVAIARRLSADRSGVSFDEIVDLVRQAHERTADARVQTYRVVLAERRVRDQLRFLDEHKKVAGNAAADVAPERLRRKDDERELERL